MDTPIVVAIIAGSATLAAAVVGGLFARAKRDKNTPQTPSAITLGSGHAVSATGSVHIGDIVESQKRIRPTLQITHVGFTHEAEFDIHIRNVGDDPAVIHAIAVSKLKDYHSGVLPILNPTAKYVIPVDALREGETRRLEVAHYLDAHKADRILIALQTTLAYMLRVTLHYDEGETISFEMNTWGYTPPEEDRVR